MKVLMLFYHSLRLPQPSLQMTVALLWCCVPSLRGTTILLTGKSSTTLSWICCFQKLGKSNLLTLIFRTIDSIIWEFTVFKMLCKCELCGRIVWGLYEPSKFYYDNMTSVRFDRADLIPTQSRLLSYSMHSNAMWVVVGSYCVFKSVPWVCAIAEKILKLSPLEIWCCLPLKCYCTVHDNTLLLLTNGNVLSIYSQWTSTSSLL